MFALETAVETNRFPSVLEGNLLLSLLRVKRLAEFINRTLIRRDRELIVLCLLLWNETMIRRKRRDEAK